MFGNLQYPCNVVSYRAPGESVRASTADNPYTDTRCNLSPIEHDLRYGTGTILLSGNAWRKELLVTCRSNAE